MGEAGVSGPPLLVFADDWGRHPSSCQHLIGCLLPRYPVYWVNTIGMRTPRADRATFRRGLEKARQWLHLSGRGGACDGGPHVVTPAMWPWFNSAFGRRLNRMLLLRQLAGVIRTMPAPPVVITTVPIVADLVGSLPARRWVYLCVDDFSEWPGLHRETMRSMEAGLVGRADVLIAASEILQERLAGMGRPSRLLTHGVDLDHWRTPDRASSIAGLADLERPLIVCWGLIDRRTDTAWVRRLAADLAKGTIVLVGPEADPDPALAALPRTVRRPPMSYQQLPQLARAAAVLVMPYADLPVTRAMQPLKLKEYLATGKPVVVRDLPATRPWADCLDLADSPEAFSRAVRCRLAEGLPPRQQLARVRLQGETWAQKAAAFEQFALA